MARGRKPEKWAIPAKSPIALTRIRLTAEGKVRYEADPLVCVKCGSTMSIIACINEVRVIVKILDHLE